jgi:2-polyprenyl-3-methyl-5-hydroxy-6-metoxy-1,4-benzoquinol methylase
MENNDAPSPVLFFQTVTAFEHSYALKAAIDLDLFTAIGNESVSAVEVAQRCQASDRGTRSLCDYLTVLGFLEKNGDRYRLTTDSATFLVRHSPAYAGGAADFLMSTQLIDSFASLSDAVRKGGTVQGEAGTMAPEHPVWLSFARGMGWMMMPGAEALAGLVPLDPQRDTKVLDIAASHGIWGIAFAQRNPRARIVALDWAPVLKIARENAARMKVADRFGTLEGSAFDRDFGGDYDVVLLPNFLHHFDPATCVKLLQKVHASVRAGGRVAIVEFVPNPDRVSPPEAATFSLVMLATTAHGDAYTFVELEKMLSDACFTSMEQHSLPPGISTAIIATKR